jgi:hypothetical protein
VSNVGTSTSQMNEILNSISSVYVPFDFNLPAAQSLYICSAGTATINILGWVDSVNAH